MKHLGTVAAVTLLAGMFAVAYADAAKDAAMLPPDPYSTDDFNVPAGNTQADGCVYARVQLEAAVQHMRLGSPVAMELSGKKLQDIKDMCNRLYEGGLLATADITKASTGNVRVSEDASRVTGYSIDFEYGQ